MAPINKSDKRVIENKKYSKLLEKAYDSIKKVYAWVDADGNASDVSMLEVQLQQVESFYQRCVECHDYLLEIFDEEDETKYLEMECVLNYEEEFVKSKAELMKLIGIKSPKIRHSASLDHSTTIQAMSKPVKLPKLQLPKFSGHYSEWLDFKNEFKAMVIDDGDLTDIERFRFLKSCLTDSAQRIIAQLESSAENFQSSWSALIERYENKALMFQTHINAILTMKAHKKESATELRDVVDDVTSHYRALNSLGSKAELAENLLICQILSRLDSTTCMKWEESTGRDIPTWESFRSFLERRAQILEKIEYNKGQVQGQTTSKPGARNGTKNHSALITVDSSKKPSSTSSSPNCKKCNSPDHALKTCPQFVTLQPIDRYHEIRQLRICTICLSSSHRSRLCKGSKCEKCGGRHHSLLHFNQTPTESSQPHPSSSSSDGIQKVLVSNTNVDDDPSLLATVIIDVIDKVGRKIPCRALLDSCATAHFVSEHFINIIGVQKIQHHKNISGIGSSLTSSKFACEFEICSRFNDSSYKITATVLPKITDSHPSYPIQVDALKIPSHLQLADPTFYKPQQVDILIGANLFWHLIIPGQVSLGNNLPVIQNTKFGWIVSGAFKSINKTNSTAFLSRKITRDPLDDLVRSFWEIEANPLVQKPLMSIADAECEQYYDAHTRRDVTGRYIVRLPFARERSLLGNSARVAMRRFLNLEKRLEKLPEIKRSYTDFVEEYQRLNHLEVVNNFDENMPHYFLPHHNVMKLSSSSTKLRVVFDASCKTSTGVSLNELLHSGPKLQDDLFILLLRFRMFRFVVTADIQKMYRQILIDERDTNFQLIYWRANKNEPIKILRLLTVTYGTAPGAYLSIKTIQQLAKDEGDQFPVGAETLLRNFYVDDMMSGANSLHELITMYEQTSNILKTGGFTLSKVCSNNAAFLNTIDEKHREKHLLIDDKEVFKALGLIWEPELDCFLFTYVPPETSKVVTKRMVLSEMASLFDPLGLIGPVITLSKIFYQDLWKIGMDWDEPLDPQLQKRWTMYRNQLQSLKDVNIPRFVLNRADYTFVEIQGFADASEKAYGACVYLRCGHRDKSVSCHLLCAKSKVAPTKTITVARLELLAAKLLADLVTRLKQDVLSEVSISAEFLWTDSLIVLNWLRSDPFLWSIFVAHRITKIQEATAISNWRHIPGDLNPADLISRGMLPSDLQNSKLWFNGPDFLEKDQCFWPNDACSEDICHEERRAKKIALLIEPVIDITSSMNFSTNYRGIRRVFAYVWQFIERCRHPVLTKEERKNIIRTKIDYTTIRIPTAIEEDLAEDKFIRAIQKVHFQSEYDLLKQNRAVSNKSRLKSLAPFLDPNGLIRVGGRLKKANIAYNAKHQILIPPKHKFTRLLIEFFHFRTFHSGPNVVLTAVRAKFWPINGLTEVKGIIHRCQWCFRLNPKFITQLMGDLPEDRTDSEDGRPFAVSGVDFAGPFVVKHHIRCRSPKKVYVALFICFRTKAVFLELIPDLTTEAFIRGLKRFVAGVGTKVKKIYSDNATNFRGAANELNELKMTIKKDRKIIERACDNDFIKWSFIPPRSPNFGGLWEASIKLVKRLMRNVIGSTELTVDELHTIVKQVATIVNSRPITPISSDPNDLEPLTPGHFIYGGLPTALPERTADTSKINYHKTHQKIGLMNRIFWDRFKSEYLNMLQSRNKWLVKTDKFTVGTMVLLKDDLSSPLNWPLGKIIEIMPDKDGTVRVVKVHTTKGDFVRGISGVAILPMESNE